MLGTCLDNVRRTVPLVHNITNYVTVNDVANILLACGGSPIMSDEPEDVEDITAICGGLNINIGTLNQRSIQGMFRAGKKAAELGHVLLLDPVGAGASALRTNTAVELMQALPFTVIRGNISEIKTLALGSGTTKGVDADVAIAGISVVDAAETSGIGTKVIANEATTAGTGALDQFVGKSGAGSLVVKTNIDAVSGATVTTKGITKGANAALAAAEAMA